MTKEYAIQFLIDISWKLGTTGMDHLTDKDGDKMREAIDVLAGNKKDIPVAPAKSKQPRYGMGYDYYDYECPVCGWFLAFEPEGDRYKRNGFKSRCHNCGELIDWSMEPVKEDTSDIDGVTFWP